MSNLKLKVGNDSLYLDVDEMLKNVEVFSKDSEDRDTIEINLPRFEFFKLMMDTVCNTVDDIDDNLGVLALNKLPVSSKLAINTLIKYKIIKKL